MTVDVEAELLSAYRSMYQGIAESDTDLLDDLLGRRLHADPHDRVHPVERNAVGPLGTIHRPRICPVVSHGWRAHRSSYITGQEILVDDSCDQLLSTYVPHPFLRGA